MTTNHPIVLGYIRVSTAEQREGWSLGLQEQRIRDACTREGWILAEVFRDEGRSGSRAVTRPGLMACLRRLSQGGYGALMVLREDRLARSIADAADIRTEIFRSSANLVVLEPWSVEQPEHQDLLENSFRQVAQIIAEDELQRMKQRIEPGIAKAARSGRRGGHTPPGYRRLDAETFIVDPVMGPRIAESFTAVAAGTSLYQVHGALRQPLPDGSNVDPISLPPPLAIDQVRYFLRNRFYLGELRYTMPASQRGQSNGVVIIPNHHPALVDAVTFAAVQDVFLRRARQRAAKHIEPDDLQAHAQSQTPTPVTAQAISSSPQHPSSPAAPSIRDVIHSPPQRRIGQGLLPPTVARCAHCGAHVYCASQTIGPPGHRYARFFYKCQQRHRLGPQSCSEKPMRRDDIDAAYQHALFQAVKSGVFTKGVARVQPIQPTAVSQTIADLALRIQRLEALGDASKPSSDPADQQRQQRLEHMRSEQAALSERLAVSQAGGAPHWALRDRFLTQPRSVWAACTHVERVDLVQTLTESVRLGNKTIIDIVWRTSTDQDAKR